MNLKDGTLWQWDTGRKILITLEEGHTIDKVQFYNGIGENAFPATSIDIVDGEILASIPNSLLCYANSLTVYLMTTDEDGVKTQEQIILAVNKRAKPEDYIFTDDEFYTYKAYDERLQYLQDNIVEKDKLEETIEEITDEKFLNERAAISTEIENAYNNAIKEAKEYADGLLGVDETLTINGKAADAAATGKAIGNIREHLGLSKNLLDVKSYLISEEPSASGKLTHTVNEDGSITLNGQYTSPTGATAMSFVIGSTSELYAGVEYSLTGCPVNDHGCYITTAYYNGIDQPVSVQDNGSGVKFVPGIDCICTCSIRVPAGVVFDNFTFYPMVCVATESDTYEPYRESKFDSVEDEVEEVKEFLGMDKNLIKYYSNSYYPGYSNSNPYVGISSSVNDDYSCTVNSAEAGVGGQITIGVGEFDYSAYLGKSVILTGCPKGGSEDTYYIYTSVTDEDGDVVGVYDTGNGATFTIPNKLGTFNTLGFSIKAAAGTVLDNLTFYPMLRLASDEDDTYEPSKGRVDRINKLESDVLDIQNSMVDKHLAFKTVPFTITSGITTMKYKTTEVQGSGDVVNNRMIVNCSITASEFLKRTGQRVNTIIRLMNSTPVHNQGGSGFASTRTLTTMTTNDSYINITIDTANNGNYSDIPVQITFNFLCLKQD